MDVEYAGYFLELGSLESGEAAVRWEDARYGPGWLLFSRPAEIVVAATLEEVLPCVERASAFGVAVGFVCYEAGPAFDHAFYAQDPDWDLLAWFALYDQAPRFYKELAPCYKPVDLEDLKSEWDFDQYAARVNHVKQALADGVCYQTNLTFRQRFKTRSSAADLFSSRCGIRPPLYATYIAGPDWQIASFSPELFFEREADRVRAKPMKGTAEVPADPLAVLTRETELKTDPKTVAENIMIVDMVRSELGSIAEIGSVAVPHLLAVERHRGLLQVTSTITATFKGSTAKLLGHLFPPASVTGAPKAMVTGLISQLESSPRNIYCGAIGVIAPDWQRFSVAIRTALFRDSMPAEFGIGSGIVWDSDPVAEYEECLAKRDLLLNPAEPWMLVDALAARDAEDPDLLEPHLERLVHGASELGVPFDPDLTRNLCLGAAREAGGEKLRITVTRDGRTAVHRTAGTVRSSTLTSALASRPVSARDPNMRLKTNSRQVYDENLSEHPEVQEVLLYNEEGLLTEFCRGNLILELNGDWLSPDPSGGCLPGTAVARLVREGKAWFAPLSLDALAEASAVYFINSVAGLIPVVGL